ncbi:MCP four helix bundle domain-containing protein [Bacillus sp. S/N-304-OC-R1]|nr:methyl-accepting chemotaxis protein [Bacillus sp. S/N-304-OC-R1]MBY0123205.1 MCP four helix bundle domain-containing protein [Bacillus sp. S/N-304-OC-R1]
MRWSLRKKILTIFGALLLLIGIICVSSFFTSSNLNKNASTINSEVLPQVIKIGDINFITEHYLATTDKLLLSKDEKFMNTYQNELTQLEKETNTLLDDYEKSLKQADAMQNTGELRKKWNDYISLSKELIALKKGKRTDEAILKSYEAEIAFNKMQENLDNLVIIHENNSTAVANEGKKLSDLNNIVMLSLVVFAIIFVILVSLFLLRIIQRPMVMMSEKFSRMATGDLTVGEIHLKNRDEIGDMATSFNQMLENLKEIVHNIDSNVALVASTSEELAVSSEETAKALTQVTEAISEISEGSSAQQTSTTMSKEIIQEINRGMDQASKSVGQVSALATSTTEATADGTSVMQKTMDKMNDIQQSSQSTAQLVTSLEEKSKEIERIVTLITAITDQTNLLALNAAIEAARAGEHGKGFAVVANEVRKLAEQSNGAANEIRSLIETIRFEITEANDAMDKSLQNVEEGIEMAKSTQTSFLDIARMIENVSSQTEEISAVIEQVNASTHNMQQIIEEVAQLSSDANNRAQNVAAAAEEQNATMEEISSSTNVLSKMADELKIIVNQFKVQ